MTMILLARTMKRLPLIILVIRFINNVVNVLRLKAKLETDERGSLKPMELLLAAFLSVPHVRAIALHHEC